MRVMICESLGVVRLGEAAKPLIQAPTDVILKIRATTICGSDIGLIHGHIPTPWGFELGHEYVGEVVETGAAVTGVSIGDRVVGPAAPWCGSCDQCRRGNIQRCSRGGVFGSGRAFGNLGGAQAEWLRVPWADTVLSRVPENVSDSQALTVGDILATGWTAVKQTIQGPGQCLVVLGCGPIGLSAIHTATLYAPSEIIAVDAIEERRALARTLGATRTIDAADDVVASVMEITGGCGAEGVIDAAGVADTIRQAVSMVGVGGRIGLVGIHGAPVEISLGEMLFKNVTLWTGLGKLDQMDQLLELISKGKLDPSPIFTHEVPFGQIEQAYRDFQNRAPGVVKTLITFPR